jgi:hypothetical protein
MVRTPIIIKSHFRPQERVARDNSHFSDEGLDYVSQELVQSSDGRHDDGASAGAARTGAARHFRHIVHHLCQPRTPTSRHSTAA